MRPFCMTLNKHHYLLVDEKELEEDSSQDW